jgi:hypothetical protein
MSNYPIALFRSIASLAELLTKAADALSAVNLSSVPIVGLLNEAIRAGSQIQSALFLRKVERFLEEVAFASTADRMSFASQFEDEADQYQFGEAMLMLLDRAEDMQKATLLGRLVAALARREVDHKQAMRLASIVNRCYSQDLHLLNTFIGAPRATTEPEAEGLFSSGLLSNGGMDGGSFDSEGGTIYMLNRYGEIMLRLLTPQRTPA